MLIEYSTITDSTVERLQQNKFITVSMSYYVLPSVNIYYRSTLYRKHGDYKTVVHSLFCIIQNDFMMWK